MLKPSFPVIHFGIDDLMFDYRTKQLCKALALPHEIYY